MTKNDSVTNFLCPISSFHACQFSWACMACAKQVNLDTMFFDKCDSLVYVFILDLPFHPFAIIYLLPNWISMISFFLFSSYCSYYQTNHVISNSFLSQTFTHNSFVKHPIINTFPSNVHGATWAFSPPSKWNLFCVDLYIEEQAGMELKLGIELRKHLNFSGQLKWESWRVFSRVLSDSTTHFVRPSAVCRSFHRSAFFGQRPQRADVL